MRSCQGEVRCLPKELHASSVVLDSRLKRHCTHSIFNIHFIILILSASCPSRSDNSSALRTPAFDFRGYVAGDCIHKLGSLMLKITI